MTLPYTLNELRTVTSEDPDIEADRQWIVANLRQLTRREGFERAPWLKGRTTYDPKTNTLVMSVFYECPFFDTDTRRCTNYDGRPNFCRTYPWSGEPDVAAALPPMCSFNEDVGRPVEPLPVHWSATRRSVSSEVQDPEDQEQHHQNGDDQPEHVSLRGS